MVLGDLSKHYEVGANGYCGTISDGCGDAGGKSYGLYQFSSNAGSLGSFVSYLSEVASDYFSRLNEYELCSYDFDSIWEAISNEDEDRFSKLQYDYTKSVYYDEAVRALSENYFNIENHSLIMQDVIWSRAVQYDSGNIVEMFVDASSALGYPNLSYVDDKKYDEQMIKSIYLNICSTPEWTNGSPDLRQSLYDRFESECDQALTALSEE